MFGYTFDSIEEKILTVVSSITQDLLDLLFIWIGRQGVFTL